LRPNPWLEGKGLADADRREKVERTVTLDGEKGSS
jgi:hypothetical protein